MTYELSSQLCFPPRPKSGQAAIAHSVLLNQSAAVFYKSLNGGLLIRCKDITCRGIHDDDIELLQREVGGPVIDVEGRIRGIAIASRGRNETQRGPTSVLPSRIVRRVTKQLMAEINSK